MTGALLIAAPRSGGGKTTVTSALLAAFRRRGVRVAGAKCGPDYIDPAFHAAATGRPSLLLDSWALSPTQNALNLRESTTDADLLVVEAAMGLFDGLEERSGLTDGRRRGAASDLAARSGIPVVLVLDITGQAQSAAAVALGFSCMDANVRLAGVILNRVAGEKHERMARHALERAGIVVFGAFPRESELAIPERHLGLVQATEHPALSALLDRLADTAEHCLDLDALNDAAAPLHFSLGEIPPLLAPPGQKIAIARDEAFMFFYPHLAAAWRNAGAELIPFSPLADEPPPQDCDVCWLTGGYPELHVGRLAACERFLSGLREFAHHRPVHGECGGYMVLGESLTDAEGIAHPMAGLLSHSTSFAKRRLHLGYRRATLEADGVLGCADTVVRGHEYHHSTLVKPGSDLPLARMTDGYGVDLGPAGGRRGHVSGSYFHAIAMESR
ncbi:cobyrinate a,c-diamide synthase [Acetobacter conturbans]|uniref:Cobyrinate a,c-diamide synthase n=1 Tax=Acetobacter conturbans TaxID=1737472 RepID=A0ABX0K4P0_9PROT|nr:cobyrinate a,c-diamide synthase [Acetobacter conturbans]NHN89623.1 cobyrinate a,c-diamide synthase [Acetobacter conturbans]